MIRSLLAVGCALFAYGGLATIGLSYADATARSLEAAWETTLIGAAMALFGLLIGVWRD